MVPDVVGPLLNEVRIAARDRDDRVERRAGEPHVLERGRLLDRTPRIFGTQFADARKVEQPLRVGACFAGQGRHLRQAGADQHDRQRELRRAVNRHDQTRELRPVEILQFVDCEQDRGAAVARGFTERDHERGEVGRQITAVARAAFRRDVDRKREHAVQSEAGGEALEDAHGAFHVFRQRAQPVQFEQQSPHVDREQADEAAAVGRLHEGVAVSAAFGDFDEAIEQDGLADSPQPGRQQALGRAS